MPIRRPVDASGSAARRKLESESEMAPVRASVVRRQGRRPPRTLEREPTSEQVRRNGLGSHAASIVGPAGPMSRVVWEPTLDHPGEAAASPVPLARAWYRA